MDYQDSDFHDPSQSDAIETYFARFPSFTYIPSPDWRQLRAFYDLADHFGWDDKRKRSERATLKAAWVGIVENEFQGSTLQHYQGLCQDLRIRNVAFFFQAEDGIRDLTVTGVQTCALPI